METNTAASRLKALIVFPIALLMILLGGALTGLAAAIAGSLCYLVLLFPLGMGFMGGKLAAAAARLTGLRDARHLLLVSALAVLAVYGSFHYGGYLVLQWQMFVEMAFELPAATSGPDGSRAAKVFVDYALEQETGRAGFPGYMLFKAAQGVSIGRFYSENGLRLGPALTWLYWLLELSLILWVARAVAGKRPNVPVCEACGKPYGKERHLGGTAPANESLLMDLIRRNDVLALGRLLEPDAGLPSLEVYMQRCEACEQGAAHLTVRRAVQGRRGSLQFSDVSKVSLPPAESTLFLRQLAAEGD